MKPKEFYLNKKLKEIENLSVEQIFQLMEEYAEECVEEERQSTTEHTMHGTPPPQTIMAINRFIQVVNESDYDHGFQVYDRHNHMQANVSQEDIDRVINHLEITKFLPYKGTIINSGSKK